jgi:hypothetical protein
MGVNIATQNVGGLGLEVRTHKRRGVTGPKLQYISQCVNVNNTDLLVLTETRAKTIEESRSTYVKKSRMKVIMATSSGRTAAGVTILSNPSIEYVENSARESEPAGHHVIGAVMKGGTCIIVGGVYLDSTGQDQVGVTAVQQLSEHIAELKQIYGTACVLLTGDFNVTLHPEQCHAGRISKPRTSQELHDLLAEHNLHDAGTTHNMVEPTYRRHGDAGVFSRIDYTFSTLATTHYKLGWRPMDHAYLSARIEIPHLQHRATPRVKDWIIGSEKFLKLGREQIITTLLDHDQNHMVLPAQEIQNMIEIGIPEGFERRLQLVSPEDGITEMHVLNVVIKRLQSLAGSLAKQDKDRLITTWS